MCVCVCVCVYECVCVFMFVCVCVCVKLQSAFEQYLALAESRSERGFALDPTVAPIRLVFRRRPRLRDSEGGPDSDGGPD